LKLVFKKKYGAKGLYCNRTHFIVKSAKKFMNFQLPQHQTILCLRIHFQEMSSIKDNRQPIAGMAIIVRVRAQTVYKFRRNPFACPWEFWRRKWGLEVFHKLILITVLLLLLMQVQLYYITNKGLFEKCRKENSVVVTGPAATSCLKRRL